MFRLVKSISTPNVQALGEDSQILERIRSERDHDDFDNDDSGSWNWPIASQYNSDKIIFHDGDVYGGDHHYDNNDV